VLCPFLVGFRAQKLPLVRRGAGLVLRFGYRLFRANRAKQHSRQWLGVRTRGLRHVNELPVLGRW